ncbi:MAG: hypothetical protein ACFHWX_10195 [Bacteroidota bacterium]
MALKNFVKINQVSSLSDARYCAGMGVDILGFSLTEGSPSYIGPEQFKEITQWVSGPKFAGEFNDANAEEIKLTALDYSLDFIETTISKHLDSLSSFGIPIILRTKIKNEKEIMDLKEILTYEGDLLKYLHLEIESPLLNKQSGVLNEMKVPIILGISSPSQNLNLLQNHGISLTAHLEEQTGLQDYGDIMDVLEALEIDD